MAERPDGAVSSSVVPSGETLAPSRVRKSEAGTESDRVRPVRVIRPPAFSIGTIFSGVQTLMKYADLLWILSLFRLRVRYKQSALGWVWAALQPLALMTIYTLVFTRVTTISTGGIPYPLFVLCALLPWLFFSSSISNAVHGLVLYPNLLTKMYFPREIIPLSYLTAGLADFFIGCVILAGFMAHYRVSPTWNLLYAIPILMVLAGFAAAIALLFSAIHVRFRDIGLALPLVLQVWMFTIPVVYSLRSVPVRFRKYYLLDPIAGLIENFRTVLLHGRRPDTSSLVLSAIIAFACLAIAYAYFKSSEATMADII
ncbi:MAG TPA: ABC transporter permease [Candidatus Polarisedimenticolia bacterium]|nr:ABC transporter permease [Candidatus Polarisedimenticolia bacterium]